jgi:hypothetical protein
MHIEKSLKITVTQEDVEKAIIDMIAVADPTIVVDEIDFISKRNGEDKIGVIVNGHFHKDPVVLIRGVDGTKEELPVEQEEEALDTAIWG